MLFISSSLTAINFLILYHTVPIDEFEVSISTEGTNAAGQQFKLICTALFPMGITTLPTVIWQNSDGRLFSGDGIIVSDVHVSPTNITTTLTFSPLRISHGGQFSCRTNVTSIAPPYTIVESAGFDFVVPGNMLLDFRDLFQFKFKQYLTPLAPDGLQVTIAVMPHVVISYQAGSSVTLLCQAMNGHPPLSYAWNSTCPLGVCFVYGEDTQSVSESILHSRDSGTHTCLVTDYIGRTGSASIQMTVTGI